MKRIVVCCDGTWDDRDGNISGGSIPSNVCHMSNVVLETGTDGIRQIVHYFNGVGVNGNVLERILGGAFGVDLDARILEAYRYIIDNYEAGDDLYLFGFSRGAYTVRSLAGLIRNSGLLYQEHLDKVEEAYEIYRRRDDRAKPDGDDAVRFRAAYSRKIRIHCIGVWDTVGALGVPLSLFEFLNQKYKFHDVALSRLVDNAFQALAIDERREPFTPALWAQQSEVVGKQVLEQVWFAGVHTDIGGGAEQKYLSSISFKWMADRVSASGLSLDADYINNPANFTLNPEQPLQGEIGESCTGFYKLLGPHNRPIGQGARIQPGATPVERYARHAANPERAVSNETVSACAVARLEQTGKETTYQYRSVNPEPPTTLIDYLRNGGIVSANCP